MWQAVLGAVAISITHWNKGQSNVREECKLKCCQVFPIFQRKLAIWYFTWNLIFNKCWQLIQLKVNHCMGQAKYFLQAGFNWEPLVHNLWFELFTFVCGRDRWEVLFLILLSKLHEQARMEFSAFPRHGICMGKISPWFSNDLMNSCSVLGNCPPNKNGWKSNQRNSICNYASKQMAIH